MSGIVHYFGDSYQNQRSRLPNRLTREEVSMADWFCASGLQTALAIIMLIVSYIPVYGSREVLTPQESLAKCGYSATFDGLRSALESPDPWATVYALRVIREKAYAQYLDKADSLLRHDYLYVQVEAARLLTQFGRPEGIGWLRQWEGISISPSFLSIDSANKAAQEGLRALGAK